MYPVRMLKLGVNIDHVATLRQARYRSAHEPLGAIPEPDPVWAAIEAELAVRTRSPRTCGKIGATFRTAMCG